MQEKETAVSRPHNLIMENRRAINISGVNDVGNFDDGMVVLYTQLGELTIKGRNLHISRLNVETGDVILDGEVIALVYNEDEKPQSTSIFKRIFR